MRVAALDLGSNTSLLLIADLDGKVIKDVLWDETTVTKMGQGVHQNKRFHPEALARLDKCFSSYSEKIKSFSVDKVVAVATSAARDVTNSHELEHLYKKHNIPLHIISGNQEAKLTFEGALSDRAIQGPNDLEGVGVIDVGGGSTEIVYKKNGLIKGQSVDVGSVRLTELCVTQQPISAQEILAIHQYASDQFARAMIQFELKEVIAVAGTPTTLAAIDQQRDFDELFVHGYLLNQTILEHWIDRLAKMTIEERERLPGMQPKRGDVIVTGTIILLEAMKALNTHQVRVSTRGVRHGALLNWQEFK